MFSICALQMLTIGVAPPLKPLSGGENKNKSCISKYFLVIVFLCMASFWRNCFDLSATNIRLEVLSKKCLSIALHTTLFSFKYVLGVLAPVAHTRESKGKMASLVK